MKRILTNKTFNIFVSLMLAAVMLFCVTACDGNTDGGANGHVDYATSIKLDPASGTLQQEATVHAFIDGDTTHLKAKGSSNLPADVLKARYLGINTPESTGKIEEWGKAASNFTKEKLSNATSIIVESDNNKWNADSTGGRYLVWVWYKPEGSDTYRNLNIELLQNGGKNTFTKIGATNRTVTAKDFFYAGDSFDAANYGEFLIDGKMDDRKDFGYTIEVVSITGSGSGRRKGSMRTSMPRR